MEACIKRQIMAKNPPRKNPFSGNTLIVDYSRCFECKQGIEIIKNNEDLVDKVATELKVVKPCFYKRRGRPGIKVPLCNKCGEKDPTKFRKDRLFECIECTKKYQEQYRNRFKRKKNE